MTQKQTLLFSATIPPGLTGVMEKTMRNGSATVDCIHDDDGATHSVDQVPQLIVFIIHKNNSLTHSHSLSLCVELVLRSGAAVSRLAPRQRSAGVWSHRDRRKCNGFSPFKPQGAFSIAESSFPIEEWLHFLLQNVDFPVLKNLDDFL